MGLYQEIRELWKNPKDELGKIYRERLILWRREPVLVRLERPTRLDRARSLGYRAKKGIIVIRVRVNRGGRKRLKIRKGRKSKHFRRRKILGKNYQQVAEERANKKYINLEVLNSYKVGEDGKHYWYEVILVDPQAPEIKSDKQLQWICSGKHRKRVYRGLTSAGRKSRGLRSHGLGAEKVRPSRCAVRINRLR